eukprot:c13245_g1_i1 orf=223-438(-)
MKAGQVLNLYPVSPSRKAFSWTPSGSRIPPIWVVPHLCEFQALSAFTSPPPSPLPSHNERGGIRVEDVSWW